MALATQCPNLCRAPAGYAVTASGMNLQICNANQYNNGSSKACTTCPWPQTYTNVTGLTTVSQCTCRPGYERLATGVCTACALGRFKNATGDAACASCDGVLGPHSTTIQTASANASTCVCKPGYAVVGGTCQLTACPAGSVVVITPTAASCQCAPGFFYSSTVNGNVVCAACNSGFYKDLIGNAACVSCGSNTVSAAPRANRTACACALNYEPGQFNGPDVVGGSCVAQCPPGFHGVAGNCAKCPPGTFKTSVGQTCSTCTGARSASKLGSTLATACTCPYKTFEVAAADMVTVERLGPFIDASAESQSNSTSLFVAANTSRVLWRIQIAFPLDMPKLRSATVKVANRQVFSCSRGSCKNTIIELHGSRGIVAATSTDATFTLRWRTRRELVLAPYHPQNAAAWWPAALAQAQAWAAQRRLLPGAAVYRSPAVFSTAVTVCTPCPTGLKCK